MERNRKGRARIENIGERGIKIKGEIVFEKRERKRE